MENKVWAVWDCGDLVEVYAYRVLANEHADEIKSAIDRKYWNQIDVLEMTVKESR